MAAAVPYPDPRSSAGSKLVNQFSASQSSRCERAIGRGATPCGRTCLTRGFSLVEVLVAVLVLTGGLLGLAALQATGLKATGSAQQTTLASLAAYDTIDRLRADPLSVPKSTGSMVEVKKNQCIDAADQDAAIKLWYQGVCAYGLTQSKSQANAMTVDCRATTCGAGNCEVKVYWDDSRSGVGDRSFSVCTRFPTTP